MNTKPTITLPDDKNSFPILVMYDKGVTAVIKTPSDLPIGKALKVLAFNANEEFVRGWRLQEDLRNRLKNEQTVERIQTLQNKATNTEESK